MEVPTFNLHSFLKILFNSGIYSGVYPFVNFDLKKTYDVYMPVYVCSVIMFTGMYR